LKSSGASKKLLDDELVLLLSTLSAALADESVVSSEDSGRSARCTGGFSLGANVGWVWLEGSL
jgi:hypothetical protein